MRARAARPGGGGAGGARRPARGRDLGVPGDEVQLGGEGARERSRVAGGLRRGELVRELSGGNLLEIRDDGGNAARGGRDGLRGGLHVHLVVGAALRQHLRLGEDGLEWIVDSMAQQTAEPPQQAAHAGRTARLRTGR